MKIWNTKYALTCGVLEEEALSVEDSVVCIRTKTYHTYLHGEGREWHRTRESAMRRAESMRVNKIRSVKAQLAKLEAMRFE